MHFLCEAHCRQLLADDDTTIVATWFEWITTAGQFAELNQPRQAIPYAGCAFDLAAAALARGRLAPRVGTTKLTLSAIYLADLMHAASLVDKSRMALARAFRQLGHLLDHPECSQWACDCMHTLLDPQQHAGFFQGFLNLPLSCDASQPQGEAANDTTCLPLKMASLTRQ